MLHFTTNYLQNHSCQIVSNFSGQSSQKIQKNLPM
jgi:hypothetical protein